MQINDADDSAERTSCTKGPRDSKPRLGFMSREDLLFLFSVVSFFALLAAAIGIIFGT